MLYFLIIFSIGCKSYPTHPRHVHKWNLITNFFIELRGILAAICSETDTSMGYKKYKRNVRSFMRKKYLQARKTNLQARQPLSFISLSLEITLNPINNKEQKDLVIREGHHILLNNPHNFNIVSSSGTWRNALNSLYLIYVLAEKNCSKLNGIKDSRFIF